MKEQLKPTLWLVLITLLALLWFKWSDANRPPEPAQTTQTNQLSGSNATTNADIPTLGADANSPNGQIQTVPVADNLAANKIITINTDVYEITVNLKGGDILQTKLLTYPVAIDDKAPFSLINNVPGEIFILQSGLLSSDVSAAHNEVFTAEKTNYVMTGDSLSIPLTLVKNGITFTKTYTFYKGKFDFELSHKVDNKSTTDWRGQGYSHFVRSKASSRTGLATMNTYTGGAYSTQDKNYEKLSFGDMDDGLNLEDVDGGWVAMIQHYFIAAIVPKSDEKNNFYGNQLKSGQYANSYRIGSKSEYRTVNAGTSTEFTEKLYIGPKIKEDLLKLSPHLDKAIDFGWLFFISNLLFNFLNFVHSVIGNWGWAIVLVTLLIKLLFFPLAAKSFKSMAKMRKFQPEMERMRNNYKDNKQQLGQEMMKLYKKEGINPASGCLPMLAQIPVFIAFYYMLMESVELRQAPWMLWIKDLSIKDPFYVLPVINAVLMFTQQKLNPPPADPTQRKVMMMLPIVFGVMFLWFPAGLVLYWTVSNLFSIVQQYIINKRYGAL